LKESLSARSKNRSSLSDDRGPVLRRACECGSHTGQSTCDSCGKKETLLQRNAATPSTAPLIPPIVNEVLQSPGHALDAQTRSSMESRFGRDFSRVRVHTNENAAESALAVSALAYTAGRNIVFGAGQYAPGTHAGTQLLAHELAHVVQQRHVSAGSLPTRISAPSDSDEVTAEQLSRSILEGGRSLPAISMSSVPILSRTVIPRLVHCAAGTDGAPADPVDKLTSAVDTAESNARSASELLEDDATLTLAGERPMDEPIDQAFDTRFGLPPEVKGGFMNRLTGAVRPTLAQATGEEMHLTAKRLRMIADSFDRGFINYLCMSTTKTFGSCTITDCSRDAWACPNVDAIFLCPGFWGGDLNETSAVLIHEAAHMIWERVVHGAPGSGGNFRNAECYSSLVVDVFGTHRAGLMPECGMP
jgi:hypothetical protein